MLQAVFVPTNGQSIRAKNIGGNFQQIEDTIGKIRYTTNKIGQGEFDLWDSTCVSFIIKDKVLQLSRWLRRICTVA
jgi:hypothetical protein